MSIEPVLELDDIQGVITPGFNKDFQHLLFFQIENPARAGVALHTFGRQVMSAREAIAARALWRAMRDRLGREPGADLPVVQWACALTASALTQLTSANEVRAFADEAFRIGLAERAVSLGDPDAGEGSPEAWVYGGRQTPVDLVVIGAGDSEAALETASTAVTTAFAAAGLVLVHQDRGRVAGRNRAGHEHFGFRDGVSQPAMRGRVSELARDFFETRAWPFEPDIAQRRSAFAGPGRPLIWPGHILFGYPRQVRDTPDEPNPADLARGPSWARNGSFLVVRRLRQDVDRFAQFLADAAARLAADLGPGAPDEERLGALLVGRWKSGTPVVLRPDADRPVPDVCVNEFSFTAARRIAPGGAEVFDCPADPFGLVCPVGSHIRKVNPRDDNTDLGNPERTLPKLMVRRGITFDRSFDPEPADERGLLFMSYQSSIVSQFEFLMTDWVNQTERPVADAGHDPILAQGAERYVNLQLGGRTVRVAIPGRWVVATGGAYLFTPPRSFFAQILA